MTVEAPAAVTARTKAAPRPSEAPARDHFEAAIRNHADTPAFLALSLGAYADHLGPSDASRARSLGDETPEVALTVQRDGAVWTVQYGETTVRLPGSRGLTYLAELVRNPGRDISALQLAGAAPTPTSSASDVVLDEQARRAYKQRLRDLQEDIDEASSWHDTGPRVNVTRAIRSAIAKIAAQAPDLGERLNTAVSTGYTCRYEPWMR